MEISIKGKKICELGCGPSPFAIGSIFLGAESSIGVDIDPEAIKVARKNIDIVEKKLGIDIGKKITFITTDIENELEIQEDIDVVFMNPPFGSQKKNADRPFIEKAMKISSTCYSIHNGNSRSFLEKMAASMGIDVEVLWEDVIEIPWRFKFHRSEKRTVDIIVTRWKDQSSMLKSS
jgi:putative methylase